MPNSKTTTANRNRIKASLALISFNSAISSLVISPKMTRLYIHNVYAAPSINVSAAVNAIQKLALKLLKITKNSPTKPDVPGSPEFAIANNIIKAAKSATIQMIRKAGMSETDLINEITSMVNEKLIKRFGVIVRHHELGYRSNAMVVWDIPDDRVSEYAGRIISEPFILCVNQRVGRNLIQ